MDTLLINQCLGCCTALRHVRVLIGKPLLVVPTPCEERPTKRFLPPYRPRFTRRRNQSRNWHVGCKNCFFRNITGLRLAAPWHGIAGKLPTGLQETYCSVPIGSTLPIYERWGTVILSSTVYRRVVSPSLIPLVQVRIPFFGLFHTSRQTFIPILHEVTDGFYLEQHPHHLSRRLCPDFPGGLC